MKVLISPAKSLDLESKIPTDKFTVPIFQKQAAEINAILKKKTPSDLSKLMSISDKLAELNWQRNQDFKSDVFQAKQARQAIYCFNGDVYSGIDIKSFPEDGIEDLQKSLRIVSGLYGLLKPLDLIQPYRLEMGTKMPVENNQNIAQFWKKNIANTINKESLDDNILVNLLSKEYASAIDFKALKQTVINPIFKDLKNRKYKIVSFFAKKARGLMARYLIESKAQSIDSILAFRTDGYQYSESETEKYNHPVFIRN